MDGTGWLVLGFLVLCGMTCTALLMGWGHIIQSKRDFTASLLRGKRRRKFDALHAKQRPVAVPPIVQNSPGPVRVVSAQVVDRPKRKALDAVPNRPVVITMPSPPLKPVQASFDLPPQPTEKGNRYSSAGSLLTRGEQVFYHALRAAVAGRYHISPKVRLADLVNVRSGAGFYRAFNQVSSKHVDFVLADHATLVPVLIVELDDKTHRLHKRRQRDKLVNQVCAEARLRIVHIAARASYDVPILARIINECVTKG